MCSSVICVPSLEKCPFKSFNLSLFNWVVFFAVVLKDFFVRHNFHSEVKCTIFVYSLMNFIYQYHPINTEDTSSTEKDYWFHF